MTGRSLGHRAPVLWLVLPLMGGLAVGKIVAIKSTLPCLGLAFVGCLFALFCSARHPRVFTIAIGVSLFSAGIASYALHRQRLNDWDRLPPREISLFVRVERTFAQDDPKQTAGMGVITRVDEPLTELVGQRIYFSLKLRRGEPAPIRSAVVSVIGVLVTLPSDPPANTFDGYLANSGINFRLTRGRVLKEIAAPKRYYAFCAEQAANFAMILGVGVERKRPELVHVLRAMLLGQQHELSDEQLTQYRQTGTMHVFSISGLHIAVIATGLHALLSLVRLPRLVRFPIGLTALWLYVDITGAAPSAVRAFVMVAIVEVAVALRLPRNPISALATSALVILVIDPLQLFSASFQMSYGIVAALLLLGLPLADTLQARLALFRHLPPVTWGWHRRAIEATWRAFISAAAIGTAASLISALTGILFFNLLTPGAFFANLWVIPASTGVIYMGMLSLMFGLAHWSFGAALGNHAALVLLDLIERGIHLSVKLPLMWFTAAFRLAWLGPLSIFVLLASLVFGYARGWSSWQRGYWTPFAVVLVALICGVTYG